MGSDLCIERGSNDLTGRVAAGKSKPFIIETKRIYKIMKNKTTLRKQAKKKNPGKERRMEEKKLNSALRGARIPGARIEKDKRNNDTEKRMKQEIRERD